MLISSNLHSLGLVALLFTFEASSQEIPEHFHPARPNGLGGAYTAVANDENALWTNPAGVARIHKPRNRRTISLIKFPNAMIGANSSSRAFYDGLQGSSSPSAFSEAIAAKKSSISEQPLWGMGASFPLMMLDIGDNPSAIGGYATGTVKSVVDTNDTTADPLARTEAIADVGGIFTMAFTDRTNRLNFGVQVRSISRYAFEDYVPLSVLTESTAMKKKLKDEGNVSQAIALDVGGMWTFADFWFPTLGVAVLNVPQGCKNDYLNPFSKKREKICGTKFSSSGGFNNPDALSVLDPTDIRIGISITPRIIKSKPKLSARLAIDFHHLWYQAGSANYGFSGLDPLKQAHAGLELFFGNPLLPADFSLSTGLNQGYVSFGLTARMSIINLEIVSYGRDVSSTPKPIEDRRTVMNLSFDF